MKTVKYLMSLSVALSLGTQAMANKASAGAFTPIMNCQSEELASNEDGEIRPAIKLQVLSSQADPDRILVVDIESAGIKTVSLLVRNNSEANSPLFTSFHKKRPGGTMLLWQGNGASRMLMTFLGDDTKHVVIPSQEASEGHEEAADTLALSWAYLNCSPIDE